MNITHYPSFQHLQQGRQSAGPAVPPQLCALPAATQAARDQLHLAAGSGEQVGSWGQAAPALLVSGLAWGWGADGSAVSWGS